MVIENAFSLKKTENNSSQKEKNQNSLSNKQQMAKPLDRFAASVIDLISVLTPVILLVTSPIKREIVESTMLGFENEIIYWFFLSSVVTFFISILYQTFFNYVYGASLGKMIFQLRVLNIWSGRRLSLGESFVRSLIWSIEAMFLFIPTLVILSNHFRRSFHDKLSDSHVICLREGGFSLSPTEFEKSFVKGVFSSVFVFIFVFVVSQVWSIFYLLKDYNYQSSVFEENGTLCAEVGSAQKQWPEEGKKVAHRLSVALSLFSSGEIPKSCLEKEADFALQFEEKLDLAHLAKAFVHFYNSEVSNAYLEKTCEINEYGDACRLSKNVEKWDDEGRKEFFAGLTSNTPVFYKLWAARDMVENGDYLQSLKLMKSMGILSPVSSFLTTLKSKIYYSLSKNSEFEISSLSVYENANKEAQKRLSRWACYRKLTKDCGMSKSNDCEVFSKNYNTSNLERTDVFLTTLKLYQCEDGNLNSMRDIYKTLALMVSKASHLNYLNVLNNMSKNRILKFLENTDDKQLKLDALVEITKTELSFSELSEVYGVWAKMTKDYMWDFVGGELFKKSLSLNKSLAFKMGETLQQYEFNNGIINNQLIKDLVIVSYDLKKYNKSFKYLSLINKDISQSNQRSIASVSDKFKRVQKRLIEKVKGRKK